MRPGLLRQHGARHEDRRSGEEQLRLRRHQRHAGLQARLSAASAPAHARLHRVGMHASRRWPRRWRAAVRRALAGRRLRARGRGCGLALGCAPGAAAGAGAARALRAGRAAALAALRAPRPALRWDGRRWTLASRRRRGRRRRARASRSTCGAGCCCASADAGAARAPRWSAAAARRRSRRTGTRCAVRVYSPRPAAEPGAAAAAPILTRMTAARSPTPPLVERVKRRRQAGLRAAGRQVPAPHRAADRPHGARRRPGRGHRAGNLHPRLSRAAAVPRRERRSTPGCTGSRSTRPRRRWWTSSATRSSRKSALRVAARTTMKLPRVENELSDGETPEARAGQQGNRGRGERGDRSAARGFAAGDHPARDRRPELRGDRRGDELPDRHGAVADLPGARGDRSRACGRCSTRARASAGSGGGESCGVDDEKRNRIRNPDRWSGCRR